MAKHKADQATADLFDHQRLFPVKAPQTLARALDFNRRICSAMSEAIKDSGLTREAICHRMTEILGYEEDTVVTIAQLNAYTSAARETHTISLVRWVAFVRATGCLWLWEVVLHDEGLTLLQGEEALLAQATLAEKRGQELLAEAKRLRTAAPLKVIRDGKSQ
ncbi:MAG TPA: hypothetical protein VG960_07965 [Caulobacteraceae bacterium]|nr:hypothetical protein [Caulobacteraceae bacterium]